MAYPTLSNLKTYMGVSGSGEDTNLATALAGAIAYVEKECNMQFVQTTETRSFRVRYPYVFANGRKLETYEWFDTVTAITNGDGVAITGYNLVPDNGPQYHAVELHPGETRFNDGGSGGKVQIAASWDVDTPDDVFRAIMDVARLDYFGSKQGVSGVVQGSSRQSGMTVVPGEYPRNVMRVIELHRRGG